MKMRVLILLLSLIASVGHTNSRTDFALLYQEHSPSVVTIFTATVANGKKASDAALGIGSGVLIEEDQILTAAHVIDGASAIEVLFTDGKRIKADVISSLAASDVALIKLRESHPNPTIAKLADSNDTAIGSEVFIIGAPFGISQTLSVGHLSGRLNRGLMAGGTPIEFLQTDTAINTGNSGGPMFNNRGEVIGIVSFILTKSGGFDGIGFATSSNTAKQALLTSSGVLAGFEGIVLDAATAKLLNFPRGGMLVQRVNANSMMANAGLRAGTVPSKIGGQNMLLGGDLILAVNGLICEGPHDFAAVAANTPSIHKNEPIAITVFREGKTVNLTAGPEPADLRDVIDKYSKDKEPKLDPLAENKPAMVEPATNE